MGQPLKTQEKLYMNRKSRHFNTWRTFSRKEFLSFPHLQIGYPTQIAHIVLSIKCQLQIQNYQLDADVGYCHNVDYRLTKAINYGRLKQSFVP